MAAPKRATHVIEHPNFFLRVNGKLQRVEKGTPVTLSDENAKRYRNKVSTLAEKKTLDVAVSEKVKKSDKTEI